jgi:hypothetical protein
MITKKSENIQDEAEKTKKPHQRFTDIGGFILNMSLAVIFVFVHE